MSGITAPVTMVATVVPSTSTGGILLTSFVVAQTTSIISLGATTTSLSQSLPETSNTGSNIGVIIAGVVIGAVALVLATFTLVFIRRRRSLPSRAAIIQGDADASPNTSRSRRTSLNHTAMACAPSEVTPASSSAPQPREQFPRPLPSIPVRTRTLDGGVSLMGGPLDLPPEYQEYY